LILTPNILLPDDAKGFVGLAILHPFRIIHQPEFLPAPAGLTLGNKKSLGEKNVRLYESS
jgi:hypothetical protein